MILCLWRQFMYVCFVQTPLSLHDFPLPHISAPLLPFLLFICSSCCRYKTSCQGYLCCLLLLRWGPSHKHFICISKGRKQTDVIYITANTDVFLVEDGERLPCQSKLFPLLHTNIAPRVLWTKWYIDILMHTNKHGCAQWNTRLVVKLYYRMNPTTVKSAHLCSNKPKRLSFNQVCVLMH